MPEHPQLELFEAYKTTQHDDGTFTVHDVPIFRLGQHKGFNYDEPWAERALRNHEVLAKGGFYPSVFIGHNNGKDEKPSKGRMANFRLDGDAIKIDLARVQPETLFSLKKEEYPHRSVEVNPNEARFTGLALLGSTSPHHKLPNMELFGADQDAVAIDFADVDLEAQIDREDKFQKLRDIWMRMWDSISGILFDKDRSDSEKDEAIKEVLGQGSGMIKEESENFQEDDMSAPNPVDEKKVIQDYTTQFKEQNGFTPEEAAGRLQKIEEEQRANLEKTRQGAISAFCEKLKSDYKLAPALVDEIIKPFADSLQFETVVKFADGEKAGIYAFQNVIEKLFEAARESKLFVPQGEVVEDLKFEQFSEEKTREKIHQQAVKQANDLVAKGEAKNFEEAYGRVIMGFADKITD